MIAMITPLAVGNAVKVILRPPEDASRSKLLRRADDNFAGFDDPDAFVVYDGAAPDAIVDYSGLVNGQTYFYRPYYQVDDAWMEGETRSAIPLASYEDRSVDALSMVRDRMEAGLAVEVQRGALRHEQNAIPVFTAPPVYEESRWPLVTVHLQQEAPFARGIGEIVDLDEKDGELWSESEGWLARSTINVIGWSLNPDERIELRKALRRLVVANLAVFEANGLSEIEFSQQDIEDLQSYGAPVYQCMATLSCLAPVIVSNKVVDISGVETVTNVNL